MQNSCLHMVARSSLDALERCRAHCCDRDDVLFIDDGVMHLARTAREQEEAGGANGYYLAADVEARGLTGLTGGPGVKLIVDREFAQVLRKHNHCLTWK